MKYFFSASLWVILLVLMMPGAACAQVPAWQTATAINTIASVSGSAADANGNVYLTGSFAGTAVFGAFTLTSAGEQDVFVAKWNNPTSRFVWAQRAGGTGQDAASAVAVSGTGIYITGNFSSAPATFGSSVISNSGFLNTSDIFVAKLTDVGNSASFTWAQQAGGMDQDAGVALAISGTSVYITGLFEGPAVAFGATNLSSFGVRDIFITKLTDAGPSASFVWSQRMGSNLNYSEAPYAIAANGASVYVAGEIYGTMTFNSVPQTGTPFSSSTGGNSAFVVKLTDAGLTGSYTWVQRTSGQGFTIARPTVLAVEGASVYIGGNYFITGASGPAVTFGSTTLGYPLSSSYYGDMYVAKLTDAGATGSFTWAQQAQSQSPNV